MVMGEGQHKHGVFRFFVSPHKQIVPALAEKLPGLGIWVSPQHDAVSPAFGTGLLFRGAKKPVSVDPNLLTDLIENMGRRVVELISLSRKSGRAVAGYEKVKDWLLKEEAQVLIQASDGSVRGKSKLSTPHGGSFIGWLTADELGAAFGRQTVIHCALASGGLTQRVVDNAKRLQGLRENNGGKTATGKEKTAR